MDDLLGLPIPPPYSPKPAQDSVDALLVYGYVRRIEKAIKRQIPTDCYQGCYCYGREHDVFAECGHMIEINDEQDLIENIGVRGGNSYGLLGIKKTPYTSAFIYQWRFKIIDHVFGGNGRTGIAIGIAESHYNCVASRFYGYDYRMWHWSVTYDGYIRRTEPHHRYKTRKVLVSGTTHRAFFMKFNKNDEVVMKLVPKTELLEVAVHDKRGSFQKRTVAKIRFTGVDTEYRLAVYISQLGARMKLMCFEKLLEKDGNYYKEATTPYHTQRAYEER